MNNFSLIQKRVVRNW